MLKISVSEFTHVPSCPAFFDQTKKLQRSETIAIGDVPLPSSSETPEVNKVTTPTRKTTSMNYTPQTEEKSRHQAKKTRM